MSSTETALPDHFAVESFTFCTKLQVIRQHQSIDDAAGRYASDLYGAASHLLK